MDFAKNLNRFLLIGIVLVEGGTYGNCASLISSILPHALSPASIEKLPIETQNSLFATVIGGLEDQEFLKNYIAHMDEGERSKFLSKSLSAFTNILTQISVYGAQIPPIQTLHQTHDGAVNTMPEKSLKSITELNKKLDLVPIMIDDIGRTGRDSSLLKRNVNEILSQFVEMHSEDQDYGDINFLIGLLKMLHRFPNELPTVVAKKIPDIVRGLGYPETAGLKTEKEFIYDYIVSLNEESLGEFHI